jgi:hypothetical protein
VAGAQVAGGNSSAVAHQENMVGRSVDRFAVVQNDFHQRISPDEAWCVQQADD